MSVIGLNDIRPALARHLAFRERLLADYPAIDEETLHDTLEGLSSLEDMLLATLRQVRRDECMAEALEKMVNDFAIRSKRFLDRAAKMREKVAGAMEEAGIKKLTAPDMTVSLRPTPRKVIVTDESALPPDYLVQPPPRADKALIKRALEDGHPVPGASLSNGGYSISVRTL